MKTINRRDFLKLMAAIPTSMALSSVLSNLSEPRQALASPHIILIVLDALTARNMSLYGYPRQTTPNIERFAARSNVYHSHYSAGTFTTAGVASLLTGTYPWTHRAINIKGLIARDRHKRNVFKLFESYYNRVAFTQNRLANYIVSQFDESIDQHLPIKSFSQLELYITDVGNSDYLVKFRSLDDFLLRMSPTQGSLLVGTFNKYRKGNAFQKVITDNLQYNRDELIFDIKHVFEGLASQVIDLDTPSLCYFHLLPPHDPYIPTKEFRGLFNDDWKPVAKPKHPLENIHGNQVLNEERLKYDQFIATTDSAFGNFLDAIQKAGLLENSYVILTSDHGEAFERGYLGHSGPLVYEPGVHVPLLISAPEQTTRRDFHSVTNSVDLVPTILNFSGLEIPDWCEGKILPGYGGEPDDTRATFSMDIKLASAFGDLSPITIAMYEGDHKIIYYEGYGEKASPYNTGLFELYNLRDDPEEINDLIDSEKAIAQQMQDHLLETYHTANQAFEDM
jgi:arylsulfatase A-like enzyme